MGASPNLNSRSIKEMRLYIFLVVISLSFVFQKYTPASCHFIEVGDEAFIDLGKKFPSVGYFSFPGEPPFASGTLVNVGPSELYNRVVITCAHIFDDEEDTHEIPFTCGDDKPTQGKVFLCPQYSDLKGAGSMFYDIAMFVLERPLLSVSSVRGDDASGEGLICKNIISVGYGETGHFLGKYCIEDLERRASYSFVHPSCSQWMESWNFTSDFGKESSTVYTILNKYCLTLTPSKNGRFIDEHTPRDFSYVPPHAPVGLLGPGDSGGGCFDESGVFVGVLSRGSVYLLAKEYVLKEECYEKYKTYYDDPNCDYSRGFSEEDFENHKPGAPLKEVVKLPLIVPDTSQYFTPTYDLENIPPKKKIEVSSGMVLFSAHKPWI